MLLFTNVTSETSVANDSFTSFFARDIKLYRLRHKSIKFLSNEQ